MEFNYKGNIIFLEKNNNETLDIFLKRGDFIIKNINNDVQLDVIIKYSYIFIYSKYFDCLYNKTLMENLKKQFITDL